MAELHSSSHHVNEFNRHEDHHEEEQEEKGLLYNNSLSHKVSIWLLYLCPILYLSMIFIMAICMVSATGISQYNLTTDSINVLQNFYKNQDLAPIRNISLVVINNTDLNTTTTTTTATTTTTNTISTLSTKTHKSKKNNKSTRNLAETTTNTSNVTECPTNYSKMSFYNFPGIESGCLCQDGSTHTSAYCLLTTTTDCQSVTSLKNQDFYEFEEAYLCVLHYEVDEIKALTSTTCEENYSKCMTGHCVKTGLECPITSVSAENLTSQTETLTVGNATYYVSRNETKEAIVSVESTISNPSCLNPDSFPSTFSGNYYPYWRTPLSGCDEFGDATNWTSEFGSQNQTNFFEDNSVWESLSALPYFTNYQNSSDLFKLRTVSRIASGKSSECISLQSSLSDVSDSSENALESIVNISIANLILSILAIILCLCYYFCRTCKLFKRLIFQSSIVYIIVLLFCLVLMILCFVMAGVYWENESSINADVDALDVVNQALTENCFSETPGIVSALNNLVTYLDVSESWVFGAVIFLFVWSIIWLVVWVVCYAFRKFYLHDFVIRRP